MFSLSLRLIVRLRLSDAFKQNRSGFVVWILRNEFAAEGFGKKRGREFLDVRLGFRVARFNLVGQCEQAVYSADIFLAIQFRVAHPIRGQH